MFYDYNDIITVAELAEMLQIGKNTAYKLVNSGELESFKIGGTHKIPKEAVTKYILQKCRNSKSSHK